MTFARTRNIAAAALLTAAAAAVADPMIASWPATEPGATSAVSAAALSGWYAVARTETDTVELRGVRGELMHTIVRADLQSLLPWMSLDSTADGPSAIAFSDSGRLLFIGVHDDSPAGDGFPSDGILRYDTVLGTLALFTRTELSDQTGPAGSADPAVAFCHYRGTLYAGTEEGHVQIHAAGMDALFSILPSSVSLGSPVRGLAVDRDRDLLYALTEASLHRGSTAGGIPVFDTVGAIFGGRGLGVSAAYGNFGTGDVFIARDDAGTGSVLRVPGLQAIGFQSFAPSTYADLNAPPTDLDTTACGRMLVATTAGPVLVADGADTRLGFESWLADEFAQVAAFGRGLVSPDGEPAGWVIDGDVATGGTRFHPATPDGAAWVVLLLLMDDHLNAAPDAQDLVRLILRRYAGLAGDGIAPLRSADGIFKHWINPFTGNTEPGWLDEYATLSTMKIVLAADRARRFYPGDAVIAEAADAIIGGVTNWSGYLQPGTDALFFQGAAGGGPAGGASRPFHEGIIFVEQADAFDDVGGAFTRWLDRGLMPSATFAAGLPVSTNNAGVHLSAFVSLYSHLVQSPFRDDPSWRAHIDHLLGSHGAWTDDAGPRYMTVFSAGSSGPEFGGYHADSLSDHPGDITTFPSLMAFCGDGRTATAAAAYHAYRRGARQLFASGADLLYRRSDTTLGFTPGGAGLPDVALGALGLAELIAPGSVESVLAGEYGQAGCIADLAPPAGVLDLADINAFVSGFIAQSAVSDLDGNGIYDLADIGLFIDGFLGGCP